MYFTVMLKYLKKLRSNFRIDARYLYALTGLILIILISIPLAEKVSKRYTINREIKELEQEIARIESKNNDFSGLIDYLESDQFINEQARLKLNYKSPGEEVLIIKDANNATTTADAQAADYSGVGQVQSLKKANNFVKWFNYFINVGKYGG
jgi:cell division protein FtsB